MTPATGNPAPACPATAHPAAAGWPPAGPASTDPTCGGAAGWPLVLYFHHVNPRVHHYTALAPDEFRRALHTVLELVGPAIDPADIRPGFTPPDHPCLLITFDDGYRDNADLAAPVLAEFGVRALLFCVTGQLDRACALDPVTRDGLPPRQQYLTWAEAGRLAAAGHVIAPHTLTHPKLTDLDERAAAREVRASIDAVAVRTGRPAGAFAYPYGLIPARDPVPPGVLAFGTVKSAPAPWSRRPHDIRRSYLPVGATERWRRLATGWRQQWYGSR